MIDLFGEEVPEEAPSLVRGLRARLLGPQNYRRSYLKSQCCATCARHREIRMQRKYYKCEILGFSASPATDVRAGYVCNAWKEQKK